MNKITIFTDGACINNGKKNTLGSIGIYSPDIEDLKFGKLIEDKLIKITNQTMELLACIETFNYLKNLTIDINFIYIYTDSSYVINCMTKWYKKWNDNNWLTVKGKPVLNKELIQLLYSLKQKYFVIFKHIKSHQEEPEKNNPIYEYWYGNFIADKLARDACKININNDISNENVSNENLNISIQNLLNV